MRYSLRSLLVAGMVLPPLLAAAYVYGPIAVNACFVKRPKLIIVIGPSQSMKQDLSRLERMATGSLPSSQAPAQNPPKP